MNWTVCSQPGCPELTRRGRCDDHRRDAERQRGSAARRGYDAKWRRTRGRYLAQHAMCEHEGCAAKATDVHHLDGLGPQGPDGHKWANLQALCASHHAAITARMQPGGWRR